MYLKISKTVNFRNSIQYDIGTTRGGFDIHDDGVSEFLAVNLENTKNLGEYFNVFIEINCYD